MKNFIIVIGMLITMVGNIFADNLSVADIQLSAGEEKQIAINLTNPDCQYVAFQFDLTLPEGVVIPKDNNGAFAAVLNAERRSDHGERPTVGKVGNGDNTYRFISYSGSNSAYLGTDGALVYVTLKADATLPYGNFTATINNAKFTESNGQKHTFSELSFVIRNPEPAPTITITAKDMTRGYGEANPQFEYTVTGGTLQGEPVLSCNATPTSAVGEYEIVVNKGNITYENVILVNGTLRVEEAPLIIKADDKQMTQGEKLPEFTATYTGFKNNETESVLTQEPVFKCDATSESEAGIYDITPQNAKAQNYTLKYEKGTLTIKAKPEPVDEDKLSVGNIVIETGREKQVPIFLTNKNHQYVAFQFDLNLPEGITVTEAKLNTKRMKDHQIDVSQLSSGAYRLLVYSGSNATFAYNSGAILSLILRADEYLTVGTFQATITNQKFTVADGTKYSFEDISFNITLEDHFVIVTLDKDWQMFCCDKDLCNCVTGLNAYIASGRDLTEGQVIMTQIRDIPAGTGVLLVGETGKSYPLLIKDAEYTYSNFLKGVLEGIAITTGYILDDKKFKPVSETTMIANRSAYLNLEPTAQELVVILEDHLNTNITTLDGQESNANSTWFTLQGTRLLETPSRPGIYIQNGKKVYVK